MGGRAAVGRATIVSLLLLPSISFAHARLVSPAPRTTTIGKTPPCDGVPRGATPTVLTAGQMLEVDWVETIDHPGHFELAISPANDQDFVTLLGNIPDESFVFDETEHDYAITLQVPSAPCDACTLQLIQFMSDHAPGSQYYYSCADIQIVADGGSTTTTLTSGSSTTSSTSTTIPATCDGLASYDRATCLIARATGLPLCGGETVGGRLRHALMAGLEKIRSLLDDAVAPTTSVARAKRRLAAAHRRLGKLRHKPAPAEHRGRVSTGCAAIIGALLDDLGAAMDLLAAELGVAAG